MFSLSLTRYSITCLNEKYDRCNYMTLTIFILAIVFGTVICQLIMFFGRILELCCGVTIKYPRIKISSTIVQSKVLTPIMTHCHPNECHMWCRNYLSLPSHTSIFAEYIPYIYNVAKLCNVAIYLFKCEKESTYKKHLSLVWISQ